jgi:hypothetical protein
LTKVDAGDLMKRAWKAVEKSGHPESLQQVAFQEAVAILRSEGTPEPRDAGKIVTPAPARTGQASKSAKRNGGQAGEHVAVDENTFFKQLADESGMPEADLRDILTLGTGGDVHVTPPTRRLGTTIATQARTVIALVAGARSKGLGERPVNAEAVRREAQRKGCYDKNNFANHLRPMNGFNAGASSAEIVPTSRWLDDFRAAVNQVHGRTTTADAS